MKPCARPKMCSGSLRHRITIVQRSLSASDPWSAEANYTYTTIHTCRAKIETKGGVSEFNKVEVRGEKVSHIFTIRHTRTEIDSRNRVSDASGNIYKILEIEDPGEWNDFLKLYCAREGEETREAAL